MASRRESGKPRGEAERAYPSALSVRYDTMTGQVVIELGGGLELRFRAEEAQGLSGASDEALSEIEISPFGLGLHWPQLDADLYVPGLLEGCLGSRAWMASRMGAAGGVVRSEAKAAASRSNGKLGGRPKKSAAA